MMGKPRILAAELPQLTRKSAQLQELDRLEWAAGLCLTAFGVLVGIRANVPDVIERLDEYLPPGWKKSRSQLVDTLYSLSVASPDDGEDRGNLHLLYEDEDEIARSVDLDRVLEILESSVRQNVAEVCPDRVFVHASVAGWRGKAILLPGNSLSGKTTLVAELVRSGAEYYSDEYAVLDSEGWVHPYPGFLMEKAERAILVDFLTPVWVKVTGEGGAECDSRREACLQSGNPVFQTQLRRLSGRGWRGSSEVPGSEAWAGILDFLRLN